VQYRYNVPCCVKLHRDIVVTMLLRSFPVSSLSNESFVLDKGSVLTTEDGNMSCRPAALCLLVFSSPY
jgi:hypothetical protein